MDNEILIKRLKYKQDEELRRKELYKLFYKNATWYDKIKINIRRFFESRRK